MDRNPNLEARGTPLSPPDLALAHARSSGRTLDVRVRGGRQDGSCYTLFDGMVVGRGGDVDLHLPDPKASRHHARFVLGQAGLRIEDLDSHNGTFVNDERITTRILRGGDTIQIGGTLLDLIPPSGQNVTETLDAGGGEPIGRAAWPKAVISTRTLARLSAGDDPLKELGLPTEESVVDADPDVLRELARKAHEYAVVHSISRAVGWATSLRELLHETLRHLCRYTGADRGHIVMLDAETGQVERTVAFSTDDAGRAPERSVSRSIINWVMEHRAAVVTEDARSDGRFDAGHSVVELDIRSALCAPIVTEEKVIGILQLDRIGRKLAFDDGELELVTVVLPVVGLAIQNTRLVESQRRMIEDLQRTQGDLVRAQDVLVAREKMAVVGKFAAGLAHEIRNALAPFELLELALEQTEDEELRCDLVVMRDAYRRMHLLVDEIRTVAKGTSKELDLRPHDVDSLIRNLVTLMHCDKGVSQHEIRVAPEPVPPTVFDESRIAQVLINLIRNAAQAMEEPGVITLHYRLDPRDPASLLIEVSDHGPGIPSALLDRIWEPFFTTRKETGTGLGLDVSRRIVEQHGGSITVRSVVGVGTTMAVRLPRGGASSRRQS